MLKIHSSFSKKVPVEGIRMSSQSYHATVEMELPDGLTSKQLQQKIHETFELVRNSVESELSGGAGGSRNNGNNSGQNKGTSNSGKQHPVSRKQLRFIRDLGANRGYRQTDLNAIAFDRFGVEMVNNLSRMQASRLIDQLQTSGGTGETRRAA